MALNIPVTSIIDEKAPELLVMVIGAYSDNWIEWEKF